MEISREYDIWQRRGKLFGNFLFRLLEDAVEEESNISNSSLREESLSISEVPSKSEIANMLECPVCYELPLPPIYQCVKGHHICFTCRKSLKTCPVCRMKISDQRNIFAENLIEKCSLACKFAYLGCEVIETGGKIREHLAECDYRPVTCPECYQNFALNEFIKHISNDTTLEANSGSEISSGFEISLEDLSNCHNRQSWEPTWLKHDGEHFFMNLQAYKDTWTFWVSTIAPIKARKNYSVEIILWSEDKNLKYSGPIQSIRTKVIDIIKSGGGLVTSTLALKSYHNEGGVDVYCRINNEYSHPVSLCGNPIVSPLTLQKSELEMPLIRNQQRIAKCKHENQKISRIQRRVNWDDMFENEDAIQLTNNFTNELNNTTATETESNSSNSDNDEDEDEDERFDEDEYDDDEELEYYVEDHEDDDEEENDDDDEE